MTPLRHADMKKFLVKAGFVVLIVAVAVYTLFSLANGSVDPYYLRLASPRQSALIIGTSRAAQGLNPEVMNKILGRESEKPLYNFAFTIAHSPYGRAYLESIKAKLDPDARNSIFIVSVDPWCLSSGREAESFPEESTFMGQLHSFSMNPNIEYLLRFYSKPFYTLLSDRTQRKQLLHDDGWLEINVAMDTISVRRRLRSKVREYSLKLSESVVSKTRYDYLVETIRLLRKHGQVYLVRLPVHPQIAAIDNDLMPDFEERMHAIVIETKSAFIDLSSENGKHQYTDGNHLFHASADRVSAAIAKEIRKKNITLFPGNK